MRTKTKAAQENTCMKLSVCLLLMTAMLLVGFKGVAQDSVKSHDPGENAALNYYQAMMWYSEAFQPLVSGKQKHDVYECLLDGNYNEETDKVFRLSDRFLREMHKGSQKPECFWSAELFGEDGLYLNVLSGCKSLAQIVNSRARYYGSIGKTDEALLDLQSVFRMAGNFEGEYRSLIGLLIRDGMYVGAMTQAAHFLPALSPGELDELNTLISSQRDNFVWDYGDRLKWETDLVIQKVMAIPEGEPTARLAWLNDHGFLARSKLFAGLKTNVKVEAAFDQFREFVGHAARVADIRDTEKFEIELKTLVDEWSKTDVLGACEFINETELRRNHLKLKRVAVRMAMFEQALNIFCDGFDNAKRIADPFDQMAFVIEKSDVEITLKSNIPNGDGTLEMRFPVKS